MPHNISTVVIPGADHSFRIKEKCFGGDKKNLKFSDALNLEIKNWLKQIAQIKFQVK